MNLVNVVAYNIRPGPAVVGFMDIVVTMATVSKQIRERERHPPRIIFFRADALPNET